MATALFINRTDLVKNSIIDGNVDTDKFIQFIKVAQQIDVQNILGTCNACLVIDARQPMAINA